MIVDAAIVHPKRKRFTKACETCGEPFERSLCFLSVSRYCSRECSDKGKTEKWKERFPKRICKTETCWLWTGNKDTNGYGHLTINHKTCLSHRVSFELFKHPIPDGLWVLHKCDNPSCVNPDHLFLGTPKDNTQDMIKKGRKALIVGEAHPFSKLKCDDVRNIRTLRSDGVSQSLIAKRYGVDQALISRIVNHKIWRTVLS